VNSTWPSSTVCRNGGARLADELPFEIRIAGQGLDRASSPNIPESEKLSSGHAPLSLQLTELAGLVDEVLANHPHRDRIQTRLEPVTIAVDVLRFKLLLKNLLDNALQYSSDSSAPVEIILNTDTQAVILEVMDQGIGISAAEIPRLNEAFYRPDSARQRNTGGYGPGLYLCQLIVDAHRGVLRIESVPKKGTRVIVSLPY
jgi:signal transduction histidine kinase